MISPPKVDERTASDVVQQLRSLAKRYAPVWPRALEEEQLGEALFHAFARFGEIVIDRLNRAPEKNFLAYLDLLGTSPLPLRAARAPLTFYLANDQVGYAVVRQGVLVAAEMMKGEQDPVLFETERELVVTSTRLNALLVKEGENDRYANLSHLLPQAPPKPNANPSGTVQPVAPAAPAFRGDTPIPHVFYVGVKFISPAAAVDRVRLLFALENDGAAAKTRPMVQWEMLTPPPPAAKKDGGSETGQSGVQKASVPVSVPLSPVEDGTDGLMKSGAVVFEKVTAQPVLFQGETRQWFVCRLLTPILSTPKAEDAASAASPRTDRPAALQAAGLPRLKVVSAELQLRRTGLRMEQAMFNGSKLDLTKDFYPFGEKPKFGDTLYLASREVFSSQDAVVTLKFELTNPAGGPANSPLPPSAPKDVRLAWEFWDGEMWSAWGGSRTPAVQLYSAEGEALPQEGLTDGTQNFSKSGDVAFRFPKAPGSLKVGGVDSFWVRVRLVAGNYGVEAYREKDLIGSEIRPATFAPPSIRIIRADYAIGKKVTASTVAYNDFTYRRFEVGETIQPFSGLENEAARPALYFGFSPPAAAAPQVGSFPGRSMSVYVDVEGAEAAISTSDEDYSGKSIKWDYRNGLGWVSWPVRDETEGFKHPGMVRFLAPSDFAPSVEFGITRYWLRALPTDTTALALLNRVLLNTTMAFHGQTVPDEALGVSNGTPILSMRSTHLPVLPGQRLIVVEPQVPAKREQTTIFAEEGADAIRDVPQSTAREVCWHEVVNFYSSCARDRHYILDRLAGKVSFGDGVAGMIPPRGATVKMTCYRTGGGLKGNRPAFNISQMKTAVPYLDKVCNWAAAEGGGDTEPIGPMLERGARDVRHHGHAVTGEDFEDLACMASPQVARAHCVPLRDLAQDPTGQRIAPGKVSILVVPVSSDPRPRPGAQLLSCVLDSLRRVCPPAVQLSAAGPVYAQVDVDVEVALDSPDKAADIEIALQLALKEFLHPLKGGADGSGWPFGRRPHQSDFYGLIEGVAGISHVRDLRVSVTPVSAGLEQHSLICPGKFTVASTMEV
jgi:hypothetical protein